MTPSGSQVSRLAGQVTERERRGRAGRWVPANWEGQETSESGGGGGEAPVIRVHLLINVFAEEGGHLVCQQLAVMGLAHGHLQYAGQLVGREGSALQEQQGPVHTAAYHVVGVGLW